VLRENSSKKYFLRHSNVSNEYLYTEEEMRQKKQIETLFYKFDTDGSGGLDAQELVFLYN
jgi:hypothetical protein